MYFHGAHSYPARRNKSEPSEMAGIIRRETEVTKSRLGFVTLLGPSFWGNQGRHGTLALLYCSPLRPLLYGLYCPREASVADKELYFASSRLDSSMSLKILGKRGVSCGLKGWRVQLEQQGGHG